MFALLSDIDCAVPVGIKDGSVLAVEPTVLAGTIFLAGCAIGLACHERRNCFYSFSIE
jgi:hypothetical protein